MALESRARAFVLDREHFAVESDDRKASRYPVLTKAVGVAPVAGCTTKN